MYIYQHPNWPNFTWDQTKIIYLLAEVRHLQGRLLGHMNGLEFALREEATLKTLTQDVIKSGEIEGERFDPEQVRSSIAIKLGIEIEKTPVINRDIEGVVEIMLDALRNYDLPITKNRLFDWHAALFPMGRSGIQRITVGNWRNEQSGPMQVISGPLGRERIHYEAPGFEGLELEMEQFIDWLEKENSIDLVLKSALAHFWFVTIHPFDDGNGRIARAIADMILARSEKSRQRFYSMSSQIQQERNSYYNILEKTQKGNLDITEWIEWYLKCLKRAILYSEDMLDNILFKAKFWEAHSTFSFNPRQKFVINKLLDNFEGKLNTSKWAKITKCSQDTALRDINDLLQRGILFKDNAGGRSTSYSLSVMA